MLHPARPRGAMVVGGSIRVGATAS
jgi:hypothetical protein